MQRYRLLLFWFVFFLMPAGAQADITTNLVLHWSADDNTGTTLTDNSGNGHTGTLTNGATWGAARVGASSLSCDGVDDRITYTAVASGTTFTMAMWIKPNSATTTDYGTLLADAAGANGLYYRHVGTRLTLFYSGVDHFPGLVTLTEDTWTHIAISVTAGALTFYINGISSGNDVGVPTMSLATMCNDNAGDLYKGLIDDVFLFSRALSQSDVYELIAANPLYMAWPAETGSGTTLIDVGGVGIPGTAVGTTTWVTGKVGSFAINCDGSTSRITIPTQTTGTIYTVALWFMPIASSASYGQMIGNVDGTYALTYRGASHLLDFFYSSADHNSSTALTEGVWSHIAAVVNAGALTFYINGTAAGTATSVPSGVFTNVCDETPVGSSLKGSLDEVRWYRKALSQSEVQALMGSTGPPVGQRPRVY